MREYAVVTPFTAAGLTLSEAYGGRAEDGVVGYRVITGGGAGLLLPGQAAVTQNSPFVSTSEDLSGMLRAGERVRLALAEFSVREPITHKGFTLTEGYPGTTAEGLKVFALGRDKEQASLEALASLKLRCRSIYCLAKLEEMERAVPVDVARSLGAGALARSALQEAARKDGAGAAEADEAAEVALSATAPWMVGAEEDETAAKAAERLLGRDSAERAAAEAEWTRWYEAARRAAV